MVGHGVKTALHAYHFLHFDIRIGNKKVFIAFVEVQPELFYFSVFSIPIRLVVERIIFDVAVQSIFGKGDIRNTAVVVIYMEGIKDSSLERR